MSAVTETIVREFFELHGFFVRQQRKFISPSRRDDDEIGVLIVNPHVEAGEGPLPFILSTDDLRRVARAVVVVTGWHTETFSAAVLANSPEIFRFVQPALIQQTSKAFGGEGTLTKILVIPGLPQGEEARQQSIEILRSKGIDAVIPFSAMLTDLIHRIESNRNYQKSDVLQVIRILKIYGLLRDPQMELFKPKGKRGRRA
jgi:hypothetical protein